MIHEVEGHYCISSDEVWRPGAYDSEKAAEFALGFRDEYLCELQDEAGKGFITLLMLQEHEDNAYCSHGEPIENCDAERPGNRPRLFIE